MAVAAKDVRLIREAGLNGARWFVNSQVRMQKPYWDANHGRFIYTRHLPSKATVLGLNWTQGRGIFCLLAAWELTGDPVFLETAIRAGNYIKILQIYDAPENQRRQFAIREQVPQSWESAPRDASEACLALLFLYRATRDKSYLKHAADYETWFSRNVWNDERWPVNFVTLTSTGRDLSVRSFQAGNAPIFYYLYLATGKKRYLRDLVRMADQTIARFIHADGSIRSGKIDPHHTLGSGEVLNDDGLMGALLCAYQATGRAKYLDVCKRHSAWIRASVRPPLPIVSGLPCMCTFMVELSAISGEPAHEAWAVETLKRHVLPLQVRAPKDPMTGGAFRGEDEPVHYYGPKTAKKTDFITTRVTAYATLACLKVAGIVGPYYGALGWDRKLPRLPKLDVR